MPACYTSRESFHPRGIQPTELRGKEATLSLARRAMEPGHLLHSPLTLFTEWQCMTSQIETTICPFVPGARQLISSSDENNRSATLMADHR